MTWRWRGFCEFEGLPEQLLPSAPFGLIVYYLDRATETMDRTWRDESSESSRNTAVGESAIAYSLVMEAKGSHARRALCPDLSRDQTVV